MRTTNNDLWDQAYPVDPKFTKTFKRSGGFSGRGINVTYIIKRATEVFGPLGIGWGWSVIDEKYVTGGPMIDANGNVLGNSIVHVLRIKLWYVFREQRGEIEHYGQTTFVGRDKYGVFTDEEAPKKSLSDAVTKALSCIGFGSDIHLGLWDDHKYVAALTESYRNGNGGSVIVDTGDVAQGSDAALVSESEKAAFKKKIAAATSTDGVAEIWKEIAARTSSDKASHDELRAIALKRHADLKAKP